jgi:hypothetical protein
MPKLNFSRQVAPFGADEGFRPDSASAWPHVIEVRSPAIWPKQLGYHERVFSAGK